MQADEVRWLFAYDRWATRRVLEALGGLDAALWERPNAIGERGLGGILVLVRTALNRGREVEGIRSRQPIYQ